MSFQSDMTAGLRHAALIRVVWVGEREMITEARIEAELRGQDGLDWIAHCSSAEASISKRLRVLGYVVVRSEPAASSSSRLRKKAEIKAVDKLLVVVSRPSSKVERTSGSQPLN